MDTADESSVYININDRLAHEIHQNLKELPANAKDAEESTVCININDRLAHEIHQNLQELHAKETEAEEFTIFRVPDHIRQKNKQLYEPRMVSIGPYYHGNVAFQAMEKHKWRYLRDYLSRNTRNNIEHCITELRGLDPRARRCYFEEVKLQSDEFLKMMLLDGCFIIEFLMKWYSGVPDDAIFNVGWVLPIIRNDLLLLENQIPFFVIQKLFNLLIFSDPALNPAEDNNSVVSSQVPKVPLVKMLLKYLSEGKEVGRPVIILIEIKHILHLYHLCYVPSRTVNKLSTKSFRIKEWLNPIKLIFVVLTFLGKLTLRRKPNPANGRVPRTIPSASQLQEAGIIFKSRKSENILDVKFQNGTLEIPFVSIEDTRRSRLLNLVSFEQCNTKLGMDLTSYACFMGALFKTTRDVTLLQEKGIVDNLLATNEELVSFFNWLTECSYLDYEEHYLKDLFIDVNRYYNSDWHKWRATLKRDYFTHPWSVISVTAAFVLLAFALLQTLYSILSYYRTN
ncbi:hypothetical protein LUZ61_000686 [Rhynchospora tenuis]|uniref:Uncharacterized protein n=1 Tax=Rhynchospora tenuis TaxID=198213 RepID=A0AAD5ZFU4_9POAL|nr:hypothetical protein LUZ61_000686 [Rhynchospora tenuis]